MTSIETYILFFLFLTGMGLLLWRFSKSALAAIKQQEIDARKKLGKFLEPLGSSIHQYSFYTTGHPYVWSETSIEDIHQSFKHASWSQYADPCGFQIRICKTRKAIYFLDESIVKYGNFDWGKLKHYDEWLESNRAVIENIARHKNRSLEAD